jgi:hypothetical protein
MRVVKVLSSPWIRAASLAISISCASNPGYVDDSGPDGARTDGRPSASAAGDATTGDMAEVADEAIKPGALQASGAPKPRPAASKRGDGPAKIDSPVIDPDDDGHPRIGAIGPHTWVYKSAAFKRPALGKLRMGTSVRLKSTTPVPGEGCSRGFYPIEPRGYVCLDPTATLDLHDPYYRALKDSAPKPGMWPYRYAHSNGTPMYSRVPTPEEWTHAERSYGDKVFKTLGEWAKGHEELISDEPIVATDEPPYFLRDGKRTAPGGNYDPRVLVWRKMPAGSMLAYSRAFEMHGRVWLLTPDTMVVPADRVSHMDPSVFKGVYFDRTDLTLPFAWNRTHEVLPKYERRADGSFAPTSETIPAKTPVEITEGEVRRDDWVYYELRHERGRFIGKSAAPGKQLDGPVSVTRPIQKLPRGIEPGQKWIEVKIIPGTLTAYAGDEPVLATLFSPGKGGPPVPGHDHEKYATTATGFFPIEWKERVATMTNENGVPKINWFTDVPHQQYLRAPLAMHVAFWHEDFGKRKSAECVNVSPYDGLFLFGWTEPGMPEGWNAVRPGDGFGKSTPVIITVM